MGNAPSSPSNTPLPLSRPPPPLDEEEAFAIATHWRDKLHHWVRLTTHDEYERTPVAFLDAQHSGVRHFEWVTFGLRGSLTSRAIYVSVEESAAAARASTIVWRALASCAGFGGYENPRFWKRVFSALWEGSELREMTKEVRLFEHADRPFPCVRIMPRMHEEKKTLQAFFKAGRPSDRELHAVLERLVPHLVRREWWRREIPVEIVEVSMFRIESTSSKWGLPTRVRPSHGMPTLRLVAMRLPRDDRFLSIAAFLTITSVFDSITVHIPYCHLDTGAGRSVFLLEQERRRMKQCLHITTIQPRYGDPTAFAAICSALPHSKLVAAVDLLEAADALRLDKLCAAWLGYALFHPDTAHDSGLTSLSLRLARSHGTKMTEILSHMATGNNLLLAMGETMTPSSTYYEARLAASTRIHADGSMASRVLHTVSDKRCKVTLGDTTLADLPEGDPWVRVIVPGVGLGWINRSRITSVVSRAPGRSTLRRLELLERDADAGQLQAVAPQLLSLLGASLTHLKLEARIPTSVLQAVLRSCPNLQALRVHHDGDCWSDPNAIQTLPSMPRLRTLDLFIHGRFCPLLAPQLDGLNCLRVIDQTSARKHFRSYREALRETLTRHPQLSHVYWTSKFCNPLPWWETSGFRPWWVPTAQSNPREWQSTSYGVLGEGVHGILDYVRAPLPLSARLACLSIFSPMTTVDAASLPRLTSDVVRLIFAFCSIGVPRQLLIRQYGGDPCK